MKIIIVVRVKVVMSDMRLDFGQLGLGEARRHVMDARRLVRRHCGWPIKRTFGTYMPAGLFSFPTYPAMAHASEMSSNSRA